MIDLHILNHAPATRPDWWQACLSSAQAAEAAGLIHLYVLEATGESIGANRADAFKMGTSPFVAYLDNDDILVPEAIPHLTKALEAQPELCGVYSDRTQIDENGKTIFTLHRAPWVPEFQLRQQDFPHMLSIYRREAVMDNLETIATFPNYSEFVLCGLAVKFGPWRHVPVVAYQRRENDYYIDHVRRISPELTNRARALVKPVLLNHLHKNG